jgi:hypothetical protein
MSNAADRMTELDRIASSIEHLGLMQLLDRAGSDTWVMPAADRCRERLVVHRNRLVDVAADLRRRALAATMGNPVGRFR